jgi:hypothetical protein
MRLPEPEYDSDNEPPEDETWEYEALACKLLLVFR